jgi:hypothetical protein
MGLYRVDAMEALIRSTLGETPGTSLSSADILMAINDGYRNVSARAFCIEREAGVATVAGNRVVPFSGHRVDRVAG